MKIMKYRLYIMGRLYPFFEKVKIQFITSAIISIMVKVMSLLIPIFFGIFIERVILGRDKSALVTVFWGYLFTQLAISMLNICKIKLKFNINRIVFGEVKIKLFNKFLHLKCEEYSTLKSGEVKVIIEEDVEKLSLFGDEQTIDYFLNLIYSVALIILLLKIDWHLAIISFLFIPVTFILDNLVSKKEEIVNNILNRNDGEWASWLDETAKGWKDIRINEYESYKEKEFKEFQGIDQKFFSTWLRCWVTRTLVIPKIKDDCVIQFILYFAGGLLIYKGFFSIGTLLIFVQYYGMLANSIKQLSAKNAELQSNKIFFDRVIERFDKNDDIATEKEKEFGNYDIKIKDITFMYKDGKPIIKDLMFGINQGDRVAIRGKSGTGKTTLVKLILGILEPNCGEVTYGNVKVQEISEKELFRNITYISQSPILYSLSIKENVCLGIEEVDEELLVDACKKAQIYDYIKSLPEGFMSKVSEGGDNMSGGQKQRILLARAFLKQSKIIILDEATSALDKNIESKILLALKNISRETTLIIIAHNNNILQICDKCLHL